MKKINELSETQKQAAMLIASGKQQNEIAQILSVAPETISRWRQIPQFEAEINNILRSAADAVRERLRGLASDAVDVIESVLKDPAVPIRYRVDAAFKLLAMVQPQVSFSKIGYTDAQEIELSRQQEELFKALSLSI